MVFLAAYVVLALSSPASPPPAAPQALCRPLGPRETLTLDTHELPLSDLSRLVSCALERNILLSPPTLSAKTITVLAPRPLTRRDLLTVWHTALLDHDLVEERRGAIFLVRAMRPTQAP